MSQIFRLSNSAGHEDFHVEAAKIGNAAGQPRLDLPLAYRLRFHVSQFQSGGNLLRLIRQEIDHAADADGGQFLRGPVGDRGGIGQRRRRIEMKFRQPRHGFARL